MDKVRDIFLYFVAALTMFSFLGAVYQAFNNEKGSAVTLGTLFLVGALIVFIPQLEFIKTLGVEARLRQTVTEAVATLENLKQLSATSAKSTYLNAAWSNRMGSPSAREKQLVLDEVSKQLVDLKITEQERRAIVGPYIEMIGFDFYSMYLRVLERYITWKSEDLTSRYNANNSPENKQMLDEFRAKPGNWRGRGKPGIWKGLDGDKLMEELTEASPDAWLSGQEKAKAMQLKSEIIRLFKDCEAKGGYTNEGAVYYDKYSDSSGRDQLVSQVFGVDLGALK